jgi:aryl-alcohol dehydrogenase-like predicted oxidoreductase
MTAMRTRRIATTDLALSEIGFGCGGNAGLMVRGSGAEQERAVARALELGINYFDNSPDYGDGGAEEALGRALKAAGARPLLNSKVEIRAENLSDIAGHVIQSTDASLRRLGVDHLDVLQIHNGPSAKPVALEGRAYARLSIADYFRRGGAIDGVERLIRAGKVRYGGFICRGGDGDEVRQVLATGVFHLINVPYTLLNPTAGQSCPAGLVVEKDYGDVITAARQVGAGAAIYSPLAGGFLTVDFAGGTARHPLARPARGSSDVIEQQRAKVRALQFLSHETGLTLAQAAIRFILMNHGVTTVLGGFSSVEQIEEAVAAAGAPPFEAELMARLETVWSGDLSA